MPNMLAVIWHYWVGVFIFLGTVATIAALVAGYLKSVESNRYPRGD